MMALLLGQFADPIHEGQGGLKIGKLVGARDVMLVDDVPLRGLRQLLMKFDASLFPFSGGTPPWQGTHFRSASVRLLIVF